MPSKIFMERLSPERREQYKQNATVYAAQYYVNFKDRDYADILCACGKTYQKLKRERHFRSKYHKTRVPDVIAQI